LSRTPILYDADCGFCRASLAVLLAWDRQGRLRPVALDSPEADRLIGEMPREELMASWHLVEPGGEVRSAAAAFAPLLRMLPCGRPLAAVAERFPRATERGYRFVADHRSPMGRLLPARLKRRADELIQGRR
jgi:predicted DCC family thiol-disulfide oxidoreductase YuxK